MLGFSAWTIAIQRKTLWQVFNQRVSGVLNIKGYPLSPRALKTLDPMFGPGVLIGAGGKQKFNMIREFTDCI